MIDSAKRFACLSLSLLMAMAIPVGSNVFAQRAKAAVSVEGLPSFTEPAISPDRSEIAFVSGGDVWTVAAGGGDAHLLVSHPSYDSRPLYSPDGKTLAFMSTRTGGGDIYLLTLATSELRRLTFADGSEHLDSWSRDGKWIYYSSTGEDISGMNDVFRVSVDGGTSMPVSADRYVNEYFAAPSPDGQMVAITARGNVSSQWWRNGHSHLDESEVWLMRDGAKPTYEKIAGGDAKEVWPMWTADAKSIYYVSDRSGAQNIWVRPMGGTARQVTKFKDGRVLWPNMSYDGKTIVFERNFEIWKMDTATGNAIQIQIARRGTPAEPVVEHLVINNGIQDLVLSPDGRKLAFGVRGEIFATSAREGGEAVRVTRTYARESQITWAADSKRIVYVSERDAAPHLFLYDFTNNTETQLTNNEKGDAGPRFSPDGKMLAYIRDNKQLIVMDLAAKQEKVLTSGYLGRGGRSLAWSPDGKWVAYLGLSTNAFRNVFAIPVAGGESKAISSLPNGNTGGITWSPDGTFVLFTTSQRTEDQQLIRVDLNLRTPRFREDQFRDLFRDPPPRNNPANRENAAGGEAPAQTETRRPAPKPTEIVFDGIRERMSIMNVGVNVNSQTISPDGKWLLMIASAAGRTNLYVYPLDELSGEAAVARQITSTTGGKSDAQFSPDSREIYYLEQGRVNVVPLDSRQPRALPVTAELDVDFSQEKMEIFRQAWTYLRDGFFDEKFNGVNWEGVRETYAPRIAGALTPDEMRRLLNLMVGELNSSHMGVSGPPTGGGGQGGNQNGVGKLGLRFDRAEYENSGKLKVTEVIDLGPAAITKQIKVGDYIASVDGVQIAPHINLDELMERKIGKRVSVMVSSSADGSGAHEVIARPIAQGAEKNLVYRQWVAANRRYVDKISNGKLGYVHMNDMSENSLSKLYLDLDADNRSKDGVVVDIRNNNGGFVNVYAIDVLARRPYLTMTPRGLPATSARTQLGQRSLELPTILVTNQHSLSDAEDFTEGYRSLKLGKVVGEPTAGWIVFTGSVSLIDGTTVRMPGTRITGSDGKDMELHPRQVDVPVVRPIGETMTGHDSQLDTAVRELLEQLGKGSTKAVAGGQKQ